MSWSTEKAKEWHEGGFMRDCVADWREEIAGRPDTGERGLMWVQVWQMEALLDRLSELERRSHSGRECS